MTTERENSGAGVLLWRFSKDLEFLEAERRRSSGWHPDNLRKDFSPATVIDVGAGNGTPSLYQTFPAAHHVLVDPVREYQEHLTRIASRYEGEYLMMAAGDRDGLTTIHVAPDALWGSSVLEPIGGFGHPTEQREVPIARLDTLRRQRGWSEPFGLKIDTEGYDLRVIDGSRDLLSKTQFVIAEVSMSDRFHGSHSFAEFIQTMDALDFAPCDILDGSKTRQGGDVVFVDVMFRGKPQTGTDARVAGPKE